ncbi:hypothetical protein M408DRAFT_153537 [Serendipita vermifera MAFF 305830]|uniref:Protein-lysine N-methyltransferase EFM4 n=1 Tax=Serendipita vermifera MAFF 305830 TaxID=933852 RepID=A0A0C3B977_SERVB|nr:hypothetical protein M408DRAFT_153537 [Serendipita vermifera MAFF 305830]
MQLNPTKLGKKSHWDDVYEEEKTNFEEFGDEGEIWFGQDAVDKMVEWALENIPPSSNPMVLDIGTGNGILPVCLAEAGYVPASICGIDYSRASVELAQRVALGRSVQGLTFREVDFIHGKVGSMADPTTGNETDTWDLLLDKGTFDAMALYSSNDEAPGKLDDGNNHPTNIYPSRVAQLLKPGGYFLITSCNFTEKEIITHFTEKETSLKYHSRIAHPQFTFGGKSGSACCTVAFRKVIN